jgi:hypothetical protein
MRHTPIPLAVGLRSIYPAPPRVHWSLLLVAIAGSEGVVYWFVPQPYREFLINLVIAVWPIYLSLWIRKIEPRSLSLYWALASFATGFLFSWLLWIVVIFEVREELLDHYNRREPIGLRLNLVLTTLFSFVYFQYHLERIAREKSRRTVPTVAPDELAQSDFDSRFP